MLYGCASKKMTRNVVHKRKSRKNNETIWYMVKWSISILYLKFWMPAYTCTDILTVVGSLQVIQGAKVKMLEC